MTSPDTCGDPAFYAGVDRDEVTIHLNVHDLDGNDLCFGMESTTESTPP
jgi:hypothetical protein